LRLKLFARDSSVGVERLKYYNELGIFPSLKDRRGILKVSGLSELELKIRLGVFDNSLLEAIQKHSLEITNIIKDELKKEPDQSNYKLVFQTELGTMYQGDCLSLMSGMEKESVDLIFADPPFNLDKTYESGINDKMAGEEYLRWTEKWILNCVELLKEGGSIFIWNLPKWNTYISKILNQHLTFKHWIAVDIKYRMPIKNRLYPSHLWFALLFQGRESKCL
jgi:site-specific DNA-methyltransferase (adenine-specific)